MKVFLARKLNKSAMHPEEPNYFHPASIQGTVSTMYDVTQSSAQTAATVYVQNADHPEAEAYQHDIPPEFCYQHAALDWHISWRPSKHLVFF